MLTTEDTESHRVILTTDLHRKNIEPQITQIVILKIIRVNLRNPW